MLAIAIAVATRNYDSLTFACPKAALEDSGESGPSACLLLKSCHRRNKSFEQNSVVNVQSPPEEQAQGECAALWGVEGGGMQ